MNSNQSLKKILCKEYSFCLLFIILLSIVNSFYLFDDSRDYNSYRRIFNSIAGITNDQAIFYYQIGFNLINKIISFFTNNFKIYIFIITIISLTPKIFLIYNYSKNLYLSLLIYFLLVFPIYEYTQIRCGLALGILYLGINYLNKKKFFFSILSILISISIHFSSLAIFVGSYVLENLENLFKNKLKKNNFIIFLLIIISILILFQFEIFSYENIIKRIEQGYQARPGSIFSIRIFLLSLVTLIGIKYKKFLSQESSIWLNISILGIFIYYFFIFNISISHRFVTTTFFPYILWIENLPKSARNFSRFLILITSFINFIQFFN